MEHLQETSDEHKKMFYEAARAEVVQRLALRDQSLIAYIVAAGAYIGFIIQPRMTPQPNADVNEVMTGLGLLLVLPFLSLLFTYVVLQHHIMIGRLGDYARRLYPPGYDHWDHFYVTWEDRFYLTARTVSQALLLTMPMGYTAAFMLRAFTTIRSSTPLLTFAAIVVMIDLSVMALIIYLHIRAYFIRRETDFPKADGHASRSICNSERQSLLMRPLGRTLILIAIFRAVAGVLILVCSYIGTNTAAWLAVCAFLAAQVSDQLDGWLARKYSVTTLSGYLQDSIADKILTVGCLLAIARSHPFVDVLLLIIVSRDFLTLPLRISDAKDGRFAQHSRCLSVLYYAFIRVAVFAFLTSSLGGTGKLTALIVSLAYISLITGAGVGTLSAGMLIARLRLNREECGGSTDRTALLHNSANERKTR